MKNLSKLLVLPIFMLMVWSCSDDDKPVAQAVESPELIAPEEGTALVLDPANPTNPALTVVWNHGDYDADTQINYTVEVALSGTEFAEPVNAGTTSNRYLTWTVGELNTASVAAGLMPFVQGSLDIRVLSGLGSENAMEMTSNTVTVLVTPYTTDLPRIVVPGDHQGWDPPTAPSLAASAFGETDYEGFVWLDTEFKFVGPDAAGQFNWGNIDWGDDGAGGLTSEGENNIITPSGPGYYYLQVNTDDMTYSVNLANYGIIGAATPGGWGDDTDFTYDEATGTLYVDVDLVPGEFKFRANDAWHGGAFPYEIGPPNTDGFLDSGGGNIVFDGPAGNYRVVLDMSNPREYTYSITAN